MKLVEPLSSEVPPADVKVITIHAGASHYRAIVGAGLLRRIDEYIRDLFCGVRCAVVSDENTAAHFAGGVVEKLSGAGFAATLVRVAPGETSKSLTTVGRVCDEMAAAGLDRSSFVLALGGGVIGDLAGFAAAIYHRGIPYVQVPTTLLAQVDSALGGKTGVNTAFGKNLLGAVHQPALVLADVETLRTLAPRQFKQGFAEIIKHAIIADAALLHELTAPDFCSICYRNLSALVSLVARNIGIKSAIVEADERDVTGTRAVLNFGHTVGHAIERTAGYGTFLHGEAIALGMIAACEISVRKAGLSDAERQQVVRALQACDLPTHLPGDFPRDQILHALAADKKFESGEIRFVVTPRLGSAHLTRDVTLEDIRAAIATL